MSKSFIDRRISILSKHLKQDVKLETKISEKDEVIIDKQFIGSQGILQGTYETFAECGKKYFKNLLNMVEYDQTGSL